MSDTTVTTEAPSTERDAGYVPHVDEFKPAEPEEITTEEAAAERLKQLSGSESSIRTFTSGLPDNETVTLDQAAAMVAESREADKAQAELDGTRAEQKKIDALRGEKPGDAKQPQDDGEIDVERALKSPKIAKAIEERVNEAETQRSNYEAAVQHIGKERIAAIHSDFPELATVPLNQWVPAIKEMHQREPQRAVAIINRLNALAQVESAVQQIQADKTAREKAAFATYAAKENQRFGELTKGMSQKDLSAVKAEIPAMLKEYGVTDPHAFLSAIHGQSTFPRASAERIMVDAAKYRMIMRAPKAVATRVVPNVQRPGVPGPRVDAGQSSLNALSQKLSRSTSLKDAVALRVAQLKRR